MVNKPLSTRNIDREGFPIPAVDLDLDQVRAAVRGIRYGEVRVIIQDGQIVQIDRLEKQRLR
ncbi:MAG: YezD family protein [Paludisphaera borealis]|uniref:YezD family protein n=1 Tax=Paludisphaera borealis TaxID=1387353 RepID=UPI00284C5BDA|nr:YezD family protein [Paludisphaera borealis]MDR3622161.1 YezD family protein [Paludisphaera borealis]